MGIILSYDMVIITCFFLPEGVILSLSKNELVEDGHSE